MAVFGSDMKTKIHKTIKDIPEKYKDLVNMYPPRPIHDEIDLVNATKYIDIMAGHDLNKDQEDYLDAISTFVEAYEEEHYPVETTLHGIDALKSLMGDQGMNTTQLATLLKVSRSHVSKILSENRRLTADHLKILSERFKVSADLFVAMEQNR